MGLAATTTLALSFSFAPMFKQPTANGLDYTRCRRRALLCATASRILGELVDMVRAEDLFLAGFMQDIAMLALDRTKPDFYALLPPTATHQQLCRYEIERLGVDHATVGGWLLGEWKLPASLCEAAASSHCCEANSPTTDAGLFARCVSLASDFADFLLTEGSISDLAPLELHAAIWPGLDGSQVASVLTTIVALLPEIDRLFDTQLLEAGHAQSLLDQARELLTLRTLASLEQVSLLQEKTDRLQERAEDLQEHSRRDALTGLYNRRYMEVVLEAEFSAAANGPWPLSVIFIDLDHFQQVNDTYGHPAGDSVLATTARVLMQHVRKTDYVARYGGEEFVIILPGLDADSSRALFDRIVQALHRTTHHVAWHSLRSRLH